MVPWMFLAGRPGRGCFGDGGEGGDQGAAGGDEVLEAAAGGPSRGRGKWVVVIQLGKWGPGTYDS